MHQIDFHNKELDTLFEICDTGEKIPSAKESKSVNAKSDKGGRKSILDKFLDIPVIAIDFIKASGFKAQEKRRDTTVTSCGVSIKVVREHLLKVTPGLEEHGISDTTVRYLFKPVKKGTLTAERYKSVVDACVPKKDNSRHKDNIDDHYLLSRIKLGRELAAYIPEEYTVISADSMNKIRYGTLTFSRYHQIRKIYLTDDTPKYLDHDFPLQCKTIPDGLMILSNQQTNDLFIDEDFVNTNNMRKDGLANLESTARSIENHEDRLKRSLFRAVYELQEKVKDMVECITEQLLTRGFKNVTGTTLKEEVVNYTKANKRPYIDDVIQHSSVASAVDEVINAIANMYYVKFVLYNSLNMSPIILRQSFCASYTIVIAVTFESSKFQFYKITQINDKDYLRTFGDEEEDDDRIDEELYTKIDKYGREHVPYPHTGPAIVYLRNNFFHGNTCLEHINDLFPVCTQSVKKEKTNLIIISDGGPDYNPNSYKNIILYAKLWKVSGLDQLIVTCNAAGWSAMNPIEHLWSPLSSSLTSVQLSDSFKENGIPPYADTDINKTEKKKQNKEILEQGNFSFLLTQHRPAFPFISPKDFP